ncbi:MAG: succinyl-CoA--3-ketoacid-CoA transferase [candidate division NC10 bacterium RIFCSPLOWO2_12_FULL_66_18]|nr:MAG: succinyl-CoA--3-ketoacid-CoA transferase [candidate division NC10 bacterium RIFCSPLOWO2_02_FULL_66_22]OGC00360.1 MAG: succinyl-CoA--3-ketoacid-CoA transferase [candidate division NC10 bacterium RIFCSPLOWO2_12_FULL_66_18]
MSGESSKTRIARRAAREVRDGYYVNLGIGIPTMIPAVLPEGMTVLFHSENGILGMGPPPSPGEEDADLVDAGKRAITAVPGASYLCSDDSFALVRGGHLDLAILGAFQVSERGDLANWSLPGRLTGIGGAMDLVAGTRRIVVTMEHTTRDGQPKILRECTYPLTGRRVVNLIITELATIEITERGLLLKEIAPGVSVDEVQRATEAPLTVDRWLTLME